MKTAEAELDRLRQRRDDLAARLRAADAAAETAIQAQREALVTAGLDSPAVKRIEAECQTALFRRDSIADALAETERLLAETEEQVAAAKDKAERTRVADDLLARADAIDAAAPEFVKATAALASVHAAFVEAIRTSGVRSPIFPGLDRPAEQVALNALHAAVATALPIQVASRHPDAPPARDVGEVIAEVMTARMRALAEAIRSGEAPVSESLPAPLPDVQPAALTIPEREVVLREPVLYRDLDRRPTQVVGGAVRLPEPVALAALEQGVGFEPSTPEAQDVVRNLARNGTAYNFRGTWHDLGMDLSERVAEERQRLAERVAG
jgi:hypothetical protein